VVVPLNAIEVSSQFIPTLSGRGLTSLVEGPSILPSNNCAPQLTEIVHCTKIRLDARRTRKLLAASLGKIDELSMA
jgi:hypothetical protein